MSSRSSSRKSRPRPSCPNARRWRTPAGSFQPETIAEEDEIALQETATASKRTSRASKQPSEGRLPSHLTKVVCVAPPVHRNKRETVSFKWSRDFRALVEHNKAICCCPACEPDEHRARCVLRDSPDGDERCYMCRQEQDEHDKDCSCPRCLDWAGAGQKPTPPINYGPSHLSFLEPIMYPPSPPPGVLKEEPSSRKVLSRASVTRQRQSRRLMLSRRPAMSTMRNQSSRRVSTESGQPALPPGREPATGERTSRHQSTAHTDSSRRDVFTTRQSPVAASRRGRPPTERFRRHSNEEDEEDAEAVDEDYRERERRLLRERVDALPSYLVRLLYGRYGIEWQKELVVKFRASGPDHFSLLLETARDMVKAPPREFGDRLPSRRFPRSVRPTSPSAVPDVVEEPSQPLPAPRESSYCGGEYTERLREASEADSADKPAEDKVARLVPMVLTPQADATGAGRRWECSNDDQLRIRLAAISLHYDLNGEEFDELERRVFEHGPAAR